MLPEDKRKAKLLRLKAARYIIYDDRLYNRGFSTPLLKCFDLEERNYILQEIHKGIYGNHTGGQSLAYKALRQGYFWPTMKINAMDFVRKCDKCQKFSNIPRSHPRKAHIYNLTITFHSLGDRPDWPDAYGTSSVQVCNGHSRLLHQVGGGHTPSYDLQ